MAQPNSQFIELNPEAALQMAWSLQISDVTRVALRILAAERAIEALGSGSESRASSQKRHTIFGRPRGDLPDEIENILERVTKSLVDRVQGTYEDLRLGPVLESLDIPAWPRLQHIGHSSTDDMQQQFAVAAEYLHGLIGHSTMSSLVKSADKRCESYDEDRRCYVPRDKLVTTAKIYDELLPAQMLLTPIFWYRLLNYINNWSAFRDFQSPAYVTRRETLSQILESINTTFVAVSSRGTGSSWEDPLKCFSPEEFHAQLCAAVRAFAEQWTLCDLEVPLVRTRHLCLYLSESEFKYLPQWAGGKND